jgi:acyl carrier protein
MMRMQTLSPANVRSTLRNHILANYLFSDDQSALNDDESFQETRVIDSMGMIQLIQFIESEYGFKVSEDEMVPEKLDSVGRLVNFVLEKTAGA